MQLMLTASAVYNVVGCGMKRSTQVLRRIDHGCIYTMISVRALPGWAAQTGWTAQAGWVA